MHALDLKMLSEKMSVYETKLQGNKIKLKFFENTKVWNRFWLAISWNAHVIARKQISGEEQSGDVSAAHEWKKEKCKY